MGCGACVEANTSQPLSLHQPEAILSRLLDRYLSRTQTPAQDQFHNHSFSQIHPVISTHQCKMVKDFLASTNGQLPEFTLSANKGVDEQFRSANAAEPEQPVLSQIQRIVWKCLVILPEFEDNIIQIPQYQEQIGEEQELVEHSFHQIALDVNRTFPSLKQLDRSSLMLLLRNVVNCLPGIGYTQGMNFYSGFLLLCGFSPRQSYYLMVYLFISPTFFIALNFNSSFSQVLVCNQLLGDSLPKTLSSHMRELGITEDIYSFSWFLCSFLYTLTVPSCAIIFDHMIKSGACGDPAGGFASVLNFSILIMDRLQEDLMNADSPESLLERLSSQNLRKVFHEKQVLSMVGALKNRSADCEGSKGKHKILAKSKLVEHSKQLRGALATRQAHQKYLATILNCARKEETKKENEENVVVNGKSKVIEVGAKPT